MKKFLSIIILSFLLLGFPHFVLGARAAGGTCTCPWTQAGSTVNLTTPSNNVNVGNGTSQSMFNSWVAKQFEILYGTSGSPITTAGPTVKISRTENVSASQCNNNAVDNECNATLALYNYGISADGMQVTPLYSAAIGNGSKDAVGATLIGKMFGTGIGTGVYLEGRRDVSTGKALGAEVRVSNITGSDGIYNTNGFSDTQGLWITCNSPLSSDCAVGINFEDINNSQFLYALSFLPGSVKNTTFNDLSSSDTSIHIGGSHTKSIVVDAAAAHAGQGACWTTNGQLGYFDNTNTCIGL